MEREITHRCGHAQRHYLGGCFAVDRARAAARLARRTCAACARGGERGAAVALPPLTGSPRQVAWAERIRADRLAVLGPHAAAVVEARWWIDHRTDDARRGVPAGSG